MIVSVAFHLHKIAIDVDRMVIHVKPPVSVDEMDCGLRLESYGRPEFKALAMVVPKPAIGLWVEVENN
ncbi:MAG: hypothetical protein HKM93_00880 [Desulfobacteraceae bacterium]|nr:hypothetical protein [Desulfobacteraceae bacterium]